MLSINREYETIARLSKAHLAKEGINIERLMTDESIEANRLNNVLRRYTQAREARRLYLIYADAYTDLLGAIVGIEPKNDGTFRFPHNCESNVNRYYGICMQALADMRALLSSVDAMNTPAQLGQMMDEFE